MPHTQRPLFWLLSGFALGAGALACNAVRLSDPAPVPFACDGSAPGVFVLAGGGREGDDGDESAWSFQLYRRLLENGDLDQDGVIRVAIVTDEFPSDPESAQALPRYFVSIGEALGLRVEAENLEVGSRDRANAPEVVASIARADAIFLKGGDQGIYYDLWNDTAFEDALRAAVTDCHAALGGTSAGAMSLSQYSFAGGNDLIAEEVLADAKTPLLDDASQPGTSGIHDDFFGFVPGALVDTHFTARGRLGRLLGLLAKATDDAQDPSLLGIGLEERTGLAISNGVAEVVGIGEVSFVQQTPGTARFRQEGRALRYTHLRVDRLVQGWRYDLAARRALIEQAPAGTEPVLPKASAVPQATNLLVRGAVAADQIKFATVASTFPDEFSLTDTPASFFIPGALGFTDAGSFDDRMDKHETLLRALFARPSDVGFLLFTGGSLRRDVADPSRLRFEPETSGGAETATLVFDGSTLTHKGLSPFPSNWAANGGTLQAAALIGLTVHALASSSAGGPGYRLDTRAVE